MIQSQLIPLSGIQCDSGRLAQLLSNLLTNAIAHGSATGSVHVKSLLLNEVFILSVTHEGTRIQADVLPHLFQPYSRPASNTSQAGLGLGLYIASQIALSHGGHLEAVSDEQGTVFTFTLPFSLKREA